MRRRGSASFAEIIAQAKYYTDEMNPRFVVCLLPQKRIPVISTQRKRLRFRSNQGALLLPLRLPIGKRWWAADCPNPTKNLEDQLQRQLELPRVASRGDLVVHAAREGSGCRIVPVGVIEHVECLSTKLHVHTLREVSVLVERGIPPEIARSNDCSARLISRPNLSGGNRCERRRIEPCGQGTRSADVRIADDVGAATFKSIRIAETETRGIPRQRRR